jgi:hypothetical protein
MPVRRANEHEIEPRITGVRVRREQYARADGSDVHDLEHDELTGHVIAVGQDVHPARRQMVHEARESSERARPSIGWARTQVAKASREPQDRVPLILERRAKEACSGRFDEVHVVSVGCDATHIEPR